jgi:hypothetical protein
MATFFFAYGVIIGEKTFPFPKPILFILFKIAFDEEKQL